MAPLTDPLPVADPPEPVDAGGAGVDTDVDTDVDGVARGDADAVAWVEFGPGRAAEPGSGDEAGAVPPVEASVARLPGTETAAEPLESLRDGPGLLGAAVHPTSSGMTTAATVDARRGPRAGPVATVRPRAGRGNRRGTVIRPQ